MNINNKKQIDELIDLSGEKPKQEKKQDENNQEASNKRNVDKAITNKNETVQLAFDFESGQINESTVENKTDTEIKQGTILKDEEEIENEVINQLQLDIFETDSEKNVEVQNQNENSVDNHDNPVEIKNVNPVGLNSQTCVCKKCLSIIPKDSAYCPHCGQKDPGNTVVLKKVLVVRHDRIRKAEGRYILLEKDNQRNGVLLIDGYFKGKDFNFIFLDDASKYRCGVYQKQTHRIIKLTPATEYYLQCYYECSVVENDMYEYVNLDDLDDNLFVDIEDEEEPKLSFTDKVKNYIGISPKKHDEKNVGPIKENDSDTTKGEADESDEEQVKSGNHLDEVNNKDYESLSTGKMGNQSENMVNDTEKVVNDGKNMFDGKLEKSQEEIKRNNLKSPLANFCDKDFDDEDSEDNRNSENSKSKCDDEKSEHKTEFESSIKEDINSDENVTESVESVNVEEKAFESSETFDTIQSHFKNSDESKDKVGQAKNKLFDKEFIILLIVSVVLLIGIFWFGKAMLVDNKSTVTYPKTTQVAKESTEELTSVVSDAQAKTVSVSVYQFGQNVGSGSGVVYKVDNKTVYIVTNSHVTSAGIQYKITFSNNKVVEAELINYNTEKDIAVLKCTVDFDITAFEMGDSSVLKAGETAIAIGSPLSVSNAGTVTKGIISATNRVLTVDIDNNGIADIKRNAIQTDAAINPGNSGGALINSYGQLIGITNMKLASSEIEGIGYAIPVNDVVETADKIINSQGKDNSNNSSKIGRTIQFS